MICNRNKNLSMATENDSTVQVGRYLASLLANKGSQPKREHYSFNVTVPYVANRRRKIPKADDCLLIANAARKIISKNQKINHIIPSLIGECSGTRAKITNISNVQTTHRSTYRRRLSLLLPLLVSTTLLCSHNAPSCSGFGDFERDHYTGLVGDYNPVQQQQHFAPQYTHLTPPTGRREQSPWIRFARSYNEPLMETMSTPSSSFTPDLSSILDPSQGQAQSWTSIFSGLGGIGNQPRPQTSGVAADKLDTHIKNILVPRVSGTPGNVKVREYIVDELRKNAYHIELDEFVGATPVGNVKFANIIASSNPNACRQLVLACHYDSKMMDGFLGATDSAVPCAMLLEISEKFNKSFRASGDDSTGSGRTSFTSKDNSLGLRFIFFDGEEAYVQWTQTDSLYGSRHLAAKWAEELAPAECGLGPGKKELARIELFVLLDLIGASDTSFVMYNSRLKHHYEALQKYEREFMTTNGLNQVQMRRAASFKARSIPLDFVEDDHVPFRKRGVPILLLLAHPFPKVWHTNADNYEAIDFPKTRRILHCLEKFVANYSPTSN